MKRLAVVLVPLLMLTVLPWSSAHENRVMVKGNYVYYLHPNAGLFILSRSGLNLQKLISIPGGGPNEVDGHGTTSAAVVACSGGVAYVTATAGLYDAARMFPDTITYGRILGELTQIKQGFSDVVISDTDQVAYFCHSYDASGMSGMNGYVGRLPLVNPEEMEDVSPPEFTTASRAFEELIWDPVRNYIFAATWGANFYQYRPATGETIDAKSTDISTMVGGIWDFWLDRKSNGDPLVGGTFSYPESPLLPTNQTAMVLVEYDDTHIGAGFGRISYFDGSRPLLDHNGWKLDGVFDCDDWDEKTGLIIESKATPGEEYRYESDTSLGQPETFCWSDDAVFVDYSKGVQVIRCVTGVVPTEVQYLATQGQSKFMELSSGLAVAGANGGGVSVNGSQPIYLVLANRDGTINIQDLSQYTLQFTNANPPIAGLEGNTLVSLTGKNFTPDCRVYIDCEQLARENYSTDALSYEIPDVVFDGNTNLHFTMPPVLVGPMDLIVTNNGGRQVATLPNALVTQRPEMTMQSGEFLVVDNEADPFNLVPDATEDRLSQPGAIYRLRLETGLLDLVTAGIDFEDPIDLARNPVDGGYFVSLGFDSRQPYLLGEAEGGVFSLNLADGFFNIPDNLFSARQDFLIPQQIEFTQDGRMFYLDSGIFAEEPYDGIGILFEITPNGAVIPFATGSWDQPRTLDLGPDGLLYVAEPGGALSGDNDWIPAIHCIDPASGVREVPLRTQRIGIPMDACFGPDGSYYLLSLLGRWTIDVGYDLVRDGWIDGKDLLMLMGSKDNLDSQTLLGLSGYWNSPGPLIATIQKFDFKNKRVDVVFASDELVPFSMAFDKSDRLLFIAGQTNIWSWMSGNDVPFYLCRYEPDSPTEPTLLFHLKGLRSPRRLILWEPQGEAN